MIAIDTNLLVFAHRSGVREHSQAQRAIERAAADPRGWGIAQLVVAEFWAVVTHPQAAGRPSRPAEAAAFLDALFDAGGQLWSGGPHFARRLLRLGTDLDIHGARILDLQIALVAFDNGATEVWTHDRGFAAFPGLLIIHPIPA